MELVDIVSLRQKKVQWSGGCGHSLGILIGDGFEHPTSGRGRVSCAARDSFQSQNLRLRHPLLASPHRRSRQRQALEKMRHLCQLNAPPTLRRRSQQNCRSLWSFQTPCLLFPSWWVSFACCGSGSIFRHIWWLARRYFAGRKIHYFWRSL